MQSIENKIPKWNSKICVQKFWLNVFHASGSSKQVLQDPALLTPWQGRPTLKLPHQLSNYPSNWQTSPPADLRQSLSRRPCQVYYMTISIGWPQDIELIADRWTTRFVNAYTFLFLNRFSSMTPHNSWTAKARALTKPDFWFWVWGAAKIRKTPYFTLLGFFAYNTGVFQPIYFKNGRIRSITFWGCQGAVKIRKTPYFWRFWGFFAYNTGVSQPIFPKCGNFFSLSILS